MTAHVQSKGGAERSTAGTSLANTFAAASTTGNCAVVWVPMWANAGPASVSAITDNKGNTYALAKRISGNGTDAKGSAEMWVALNIAGGAGAITVTVTANMSSFFAVVLGEYSGVAGVSAVDVTNGAVTGGASAGNTSQSSGNVTTTADGMLVGGWANTENTVTGLTMGGGFTQRISQPSTANIGYAFGDLVGQTSGTTAAASWTWATATKSGAVVVALKDAGGGGGGTNINVLDADVDTQDLTGGFQRRGLAKKVYSFPRRMVPETRFVRSGHLWVPKGVAA